MQVRVCRHRSDRFGGYRIRILAEAPGAASGCRSINAAPDALGPVVGFTGARGANVWLGIPMRHRPSASCAGKHRGRRNRGRRATLAIGNMCVQFRRCCRCGRSRKSNAPVGNEDCLYLNIWAPPFSPGDVPSGDKARPGDVLDPWRRQRRGLWWQLFGRASGHDHNLLVVTFGTGSDRSAGSRIRHCAARTRLPNNSRQHGLLIRSPRCVGCATTSRRSATRTT